MAPTEHITEKNAYAYVNSTLKKLGWDVRNPNKYPQGQVYTDNQALGNPELKKGLGKQRPENIIKLNETKYWVIEAKSSRQQLNKAVKEAEDYADDINKKSSAETVIISGVAGNDDDGFLITNKFLTKDGFETITLNGEPLTGLLSPEVSQRILSEDSSNLKDIPIDENLFLVTAEAVNRELHLGAINKNDRAKVMAALLLALVDDTLPNIDASPSVLINDINIRAKEVLRRNGKENFFQCVELALPPSSDNHIKFRRALVNTIQALLNLNIKSTMYAGTDLLGKFYEVFLKYGNGAKEIGIVLTPRHITRFAGEILDIKYSDIVCDPACGTGGFLIAALDHVREKSSDIQVEQFKINGLFGMDQDPVVTALAIVNMIFRNDGKNHIIEGNCFSKYLVKNTEKGAPTAIVTTEKPEKGNEGATKILMNPPFALDQSDEKEYRFIQHALDLLEEGSILFSILPISTMFESGVVKEWRMNRLIGENTLLSVITFPPELFYPIGVHTLGIVVKKGIKHPKLQNVLWVRSIHDGLIKIKGKRLLSSVSRKEPNDFELVTPIIKAFINNPSFKVESIPGIIKACPIDFKDTIFELVPEAYLDSTEPTTEELEKAAENLIRETAALAIRFPELWKDND